MKTVTLLAMTALMCSLSGVAQAQYAIITKVPDPYPGNYVNPLAQTDQYLVGTLSNKKSLNAFLYNIQTRVVTDLTPTGYTAFPQGVSSNGYVVGQTSTAPPNFEAVEFKNGGLNLLGFLPQTNWTEARGVNSSEEIVGLAMGSNGEFITPFVYQSGVMSPLSGFYETNGQYSGAYQINDAGMIAGNQYVIGGQACSWIEQNADAGSFPTFFACTPQEQYPYSQPTAINASGEVVGFFYYSQGTCYEPYGCIDVVHPYTWKAGQFVDLGQLYSVQGYAFGVNDYGDVVGEASTPNSAFYFYYDPNNPSAGLQNLSNFLNPNSGWQIVGITGINDSGQITGFGNLQGDPNTTAFVMTLPHGVVAGAKIAR